MNDDLKARTFAFAKRIVRLVRSMPTDVVSRELGRQLVRSGTSVGANYRAARRARSRAEFLAKLGIVEEEADETVYWLHLIAESGIVPATRLADLIAEADELVAIVVASLNTAKARAK